MVAFPAPGPVVATPRSDRGRPQLARRGPAGHQYSCTPPVPGPIAHEWLRACADKGFDAVEPDNLDTWTRSKGHLERADAIAYSRLLARRAHGLGLAIAQKNAAGLASQRASIGWDFAVVEECQVYRECGRFLKEYDGAVIEIEYADAGGRPNFQAACNARGAVIAIVYRDRNLVAAGRPGYVFDSC